MSENTDPTTDIIKNIRSAMATKNSNQGALAAALNLTQQSVSARMTGGVVWSVRELWLVSLHLEVPLQDLVPDILGYAARQIGVPVESLTDAVLSEVAE